MAAWLNEVVVRAVALLSALTKEYNMHIIQCWSGNCTSQVWTQNTISSLPESAVICIGESNSIQFRSNRSYGGLTSCSVILRMQPRPQCDEGEKQSVIPQDNQRRSGTKGSNDTACVGYQASDQRQKCCSFTKKKSWVRVFDRVSFTFCHVSRVMCFVFVSCFALLSHFFCSCPGRFALQSAATTRKGQFPFVKSNKKHSRSLAKQWNALVLFCVFACTSHAVSPSPGFVKLLALSNISAFVHFDPCFTGLYGQCCFLLSDAECHRCFLLLIECASLSPASRIQWSSSFLLCTIDDLTPERLSRLWRTLGGLICFQICLINSFHCFGQWSLMFLLLFTNGNCPFRVVACTSRWEEAHGETSNFTILWEEGAISTQSSSL